MSLPPCLLSFRGFYSATKLRSYLMRNKTTTNTNWTLYLHARTHARTPHMLQLHSAVQDRTSVHRLFCPCAVSGPCHVTYLNTSSQQNPPPHAAPSTVAVISPQLRSFSQRQHVTLKNKTIPCLEIQGGRRRRGSTRRVSRSKACCPAGKLVPTRLLLLQLISRRDAAQMKPSGGRTVSQCARCWWGAEPETLAAPSAACARTSATPGGLRRVCVSVCARPLPKVKWHHWSDLIWSTCHPDRTSLTKSLNSCSWFQERRGLSF